MIVEIIQQKPHSINLSIPIGRDEEKITQTYAKDIVLVFENNIRISSQVNLLPLFWKNQSYILPNSIEIDLESIDLTLPLFNLLVVEGIPNNYLFALESAFLTYLMMRENKDDFDLLHDYNSSPLAHTSSLNVSAKLQADQNSVLKIKIGVLSAQEENKQIKEKSKTCLLRLDGNQTLSINQLEEILKDVDPKGIEYIEEPFKDLQQWNDFKYRSYYKLALDEGLDKYSVEELIDHCDFLIIKPTYNFSISKIYKYINSKANFILSSAYEPDYSLNALIHLAALLASNKKLLTHGLGTTKHLDQESKFLQEIDNKNILQGYSFFKNRL